MSSPTLLAARDAVLSHSLFARPMTREEACVFMEHHVFAVWDYSMLWKRVEHELGALSSPWAPDRDTSCEWLMKELGVADEVEHAPYLEVYIDGMRELGADTSAIEQLLVRVELGDDPFAALSCAPDAARRFASHTLRLALDRRSPAVAIASAYLWGREALLDGVLERLRQTPAFAQSVAFRPYLDRAHEPDRAERAPEANRLLRTLCTDAALIAVAERAGQAALDARQQLWDDIAAAMPQSTSSSTTFFKESRLLTVSTRSHDGA